MSQLDKAGGSARAFSAISNASEEAGGTPALPGVKELTQVGMPEEQAEVLARSQATLIDEQPATKRDLQELEARLRRDMKEMELRLTHALPLRLGSMLVVAVGVVAALVKLL